MHYMSNLDKANLQGLLSRENGFEPEIRSVDLDGDGLAELLLVDGDGDGRIDAAIRGVDADGDGMDDLYVVYNPGGEITAVGHLLSGGELEVLSADNDDFDSLMDRLGETEPPPPELFTGFDDPFLESPSGLFQETQEVPPTDWLTANPGDIVEIDPGEYAAMYGAIEIEVDEAEPADTPRITEIGDSSGDGSAVFVRVDDDADGVWDRREDLASTAGGWEGDLDGDGLAQTVLTDTDQDGLFEQAIVDSDGSEQAAWELADVTSEELVDDDYFAALEDETTDTNFSFDADAIDPDDPEI